jgi:Leucine-rich repeat (LRR) protein
MSLYRQNSNKPFIFIVLLLFFVVLLMIPLRPSVWDRADALSERSDTTQLVGADSLLSRDSLVLTTVSIQDTQLSFLPKIDDPTLIDTIVVIQTLEATDTTIITLSVPPPAPQTIEKAETTGPGLLSLLWWLLLFMALAWGIYKWLTTRWQKQYWLEYNAELQPLATLSNSNSNIDFDFSELSVEAATIEKPAPLPLKEIVPEIIEESVSIEPELPEEEEEEPDLIEVEPEPISDKETKETEETVNPPEPEIIQTELTSSTATIASETPFSERWYVLFFIEFFGRLPRILFEMGRGMGSIFSFFSTGNQNRKSLDLKWQDGVSVVLILFFILCKTILFPYAPASLVGTIFLGLLVWGIPALLRRHWGLGAVGIVLILGEFVSLIIYIALQALENVEPGDGDYTNELIGLAIVVGLVVLYWASKKGLLPSFGKLVSFVLIAIGSYFIFLPYVEDLSYGYLFFYGWGDIVIRCIAFYILYLVLTEVISAVFIKKEAPNPTLKTEKAALKIAKDSNLDTTQTSKSEEVSKPLSTQELEELFRTKNWYKKADLDQLELVSMSSSSLDEQSEFVVLYLPDCINLYQLYLSNNNFQEIPYEISALEQLEILDLSYNKINTIISEIEYLKNLKVLFLTNNNISDIPTELANLTQLTQIDLTGNPLTKAAVHQLKTYFPNAILKFDPPKENLKEKEETEVIVEDIVEEAQNTTLIEDEALVKKVRKSLHKELKNPEQTYGLSSLMNQELPDLPLSVLQEFPNLKSLFLNGNLFTEIPEAIYHLPNLTALGFSYNKITSLPDRISSLQNLKELYLSGNPIHSISPAIIQLHNLEKIDLGNLGLTVFPAFLLKMQQLESINLTGNHILRIPKDIQELSNLKELNLSFSGLNTIPDEIFALKNLRALEWTGNKLENIPSRIVELEHLEKLAIGFNEGLESPTNVLKGLPNLKYLYISGLKGGMKQPMILNVGLLKPLETLWLSYNELKELPISLFDLKNIRRLSLANNKLETLSERLGEFSNLEYLYLEKNQLTRLPKSIKKLEKLRHLNLANNPIDIKEKRALQRVLPRVKIQF